MTDLATEDHSEKTILGFWVFLMTDFLLFGTFFATYGVLHHNTFGGPSAGTLFNLPLALAETITLLLSSFTCCLAMLSAYRKQTRRTLVLFLLTLLLGISFLSMEYAEFARLINQGQDWQRSGFLSSFFSLVGTHTAHLLVGMIWIAIMMYLIAQRGLIGSTMRRLACLRMFWLFLNVIWIFIFTLVYLMGAIE